MSENWYCIYCTFKDNLIVGLYSFSACSKSLSVKTINLFFSANVKKISKLTESQIEILANQYVRWDLYKMLERYGGKSTIFIKPFVNTKEKF